MVGGDGGGTHDVLLDIHDVMREETQMDVKVISLDEPGAGAKSALEVS
jgi:predicted RNA-binding protein with RPS1 domain